MRSWSVTSSRCELLIEQDGVSKGGYAQKDTPSYVLGAHLTSGLLLGLASGEDGAGSRAVCEIAFIQTR